MDSGLKQILSAARNLADFIERYGDSAHIEIIQAQAALISERAQKLTHEAAGVSVLHR